VWLWCCLVTYTQSLWPNHRCRKTWDNILVESHDTYSIYSCLYARQSFVVIVVSSLENLNSGSQVCLMPCRNVDSYMFAHVYIHKHAASHKMIIGSDIWRHRRLGRLRRMHGCHNVLTITCWHFENGRPYRTGYRWKLEVLGNDCRSIHLTLWDMTNSVRLNLKRCVCVHVSINSHHKRHSDTNIKKKRQNIWVHMCPWNVVSLAAFHKSPSDQRHRWVEMSTLKPKPRIQLSLCLRVCMCESTYKERKWYVHALCGCMSVHMHE